MAEPIVVPIYRSALDGSETVRKELAVAQSQPIAFAVKLDNKTLERLYTRAAAFAYVKQYRLQMAMERMQSRGWGANP